MNKRDKSPRQNNLVPRGMQVQLARLFGAKSREAIQETRTTAEWRRTLRAVLREIGRYIAKNVDTDELHRCMLQSGLDAAEESLRHQDFWPVMQRASHVCFSCFWAIIPTTEATNQGVSGTVITA